MWQVNDKRGRLMRYAAVATGPASLLHRRAHSSTFTVQQSQLIPSIQHRYRMVRKSHSSHTPHLHPPVLAESRCTAPPSSPLATHGHPHPDRTAIAISGHFRESHFRHRSRFRHHRRRQGEPCAGRDRAARWPEALAWRAGSGRPRTGPARDPRQCRAGSAVPSGGGA